LASQFDAYADLDENGNAPETLDVDSPAQAAGCSTGWVDPARVYISDTNGEIQGIRKADGTMATEEELQAEAWRYSANFAADTRFCHVFIHSHECKPTCFKKTEYKKSSAEEAPQP